MTRTGLGPATRLASSVRMPASRSASGPERTGHSSMSTTRFDRRSLKPSTMRPPDRSAVMTARRRLDGFTPIVSATSGRKPSRASAATTRSRFICRVAASGIICSAQPPQVPKCRQTGATRSGLGSSTSISRRALALALDRDALAGQREGHVDGPAGVANDAVAAMAERLDRDDLSHSLRAEQKFAVAVAAGDAARGRHR